MNKPGKAVILLSGGIDSQTCLALAKQQGYQCYALAIDYGQKHRVELKSAELIAKTMQAREFKIIQINVEPISGSALTDPQLSVPRFDATERVKTTYFPARNTIFLSLALGWAESIGAEKIFFGANLADYHGFPDTRPEYFSAFNHMAQLATKACTEDQATISIETPLIYLDKKAIIQLGLGMAVDYSLSTTCYQANSASSACGECDSCVIRKNAFESLGLSDPALFHTK